MAKKQAATTATATAATTVSFGAAEHGITWAVTQVPGGKTVRGSHMVGKEPLSIRPFTDAQGEDDYAIQFGTRGGISVFANSAVGAISAILKVGSQLETGIRDDLVVPLRLRTRNYKLEAKLSPKMGYGVAGYPDEMWEALCQQMVRHQFNGLVLYAGYHPFEALLDYKDCPEAASTPEADRTAMREGLRRGLAIAHKYGLKTFMQHYVGHFTKELALAHDIPTGGRYSNTVHPKVDEYCRYCYREIFKQIPELDGLYFNFESYQNAHEHLLATAIPELNAMKRKPIVVFRLWGYTDFDGMEKMRRAYHGRVILGHKISDTNDTYYLPVADSRVMEWKKRLGKDIEWMFLVGPCHNCATNVCSQLWADYDFIQEILRDAQAKGADSISFNSIFQLFSPEMPNVGDRFSKEELELSRFNRLHLLAASDYANGVVRTPAQRAQTLAAVVGVPAAAGTHLHEAIHCSSQLILLVYQQFYVSSTRDGYLHPGRYSLIQEPFFYFPVTDLNHQAKKPLRFQSWNSSWVDKTIDTAVTPDGEYQYLLDFVTPKATKARLTPQIMAELLEQTIDESRKALAAYRRSAGKDAAAVLAPYVERNIFVGEYIRHEILAGIQLYSLYFAKSQAAMVRALKAGLAELQAAAALVADRSTPEYKQLNRVMMMKFNPDIEIKLVTEMLELIKTAGKVPMAGFASYVESHRLFNEIRRNTLPGRVHTPAMRASMQESLSAALTAADTATEALKPAASFRAYRARVRQWRDYLATLLANTEPPAAICTAKKGTPFLPLQHEDAFRYGEDFMEDFVSFFRPVDYVRAVQLSVQVSYTATELVVRLHEEGASLASRRTLWEDCHRRGEGSDAFVMNLYLDVNGTGIKGERITIWPAGGGITYGRQAQAPGHIELKENGDSWDMIARLPFSLLGRKPAKGDTWGFNICSNPFTTDNTAYTWASQFESKNTPENYGQIYFQ